MEVVAALRAHYSTVAGKAEREMIAEKLRGNTASAQRYKDTLAAMHVQHKAALDLIADRLTTPAQLTATRKFLRSEADKANAFVKQLQQIKISLAKLAEVAGFLTELVRGLTTILR